jgi:5'-nucleotidase
MEDLRNNNSRRDFFKKSAFATVGLIGLKNFSLDAIAASEKVKIVILHTNDVHSHIEPFPDNDPRFAGLGGVARRAALISKIRSEEKNVLLFDAGDIYQGTPYFNRFGGELEFKLMSKMQYDASAIGNHDFDNGIDGIVKNLPLATFPFLCANYDFSDTAMSGKTEAYKVFEKQGIKIGVFGLGIEFEGLVDRKNYLNTKYLDPLIKAAEVTAHLKNDLKCDLIVCLSHLGFSYPDDKVSDKVLAEQSKNIDIIIGGHTHTFLEKPVVMKNRDGKEVHICQVGWAGIRLGKIEVEFEKSGKKKTISGSALGINQQLDFI